MLGDLHINVKSKGKKSVTKAKNGSNPGGGGGCEDPTFVCRSDWDVVYKSSHFPFSKLDFRGSFISFTASSLQAIWSKKEVLQSHYQQKISNKFAYIDKI